MSTALSNTDFINFTTTDFTTASNLSQPSQANARMLEAEQARAYRRILMHLNHADKTECQLGVEVCWAFDDPRYIAVLSYIKDWAFVCIVEHLEGLVVQRLFELSKANLVTTGVFLKLNAPYTDAKNLDRL